MLALPWRQILLRVFQEKKAASDRANTTIRPNANATAWERKHFMKLKWYLTYYHNNLTPHFKTTHLLWVHEAVVVQVLVVHGKPPRKASSYAATKAGPVRNVLAHHQDWIVQHALWALGHWVDSNHKNDVNDALQLMESPSRSMLWPQSSGTVIFCLLKKYIYLSLY